MRRQFKRYSLAMGVGAGAAYLFGIGLSLVIGNPLGEQASDFWFPVIGAVAGASLLLLWDTAPRDEFEIGE
jgi:predicted MFS family arabinose efflux permease